MMHEKVFDTYIISLYILKVALVKVNDLCTPHKTIRILSNAAVVKGAKFIAKDLIVMIMKEKNFMHIHIVKQTNNINWQII